MPEIRKESLKSDILPHQKVLKQIRIDLKKPAKTVEAAVKEATPYLHNYLNTLGFTMHVRLVTASVSRIDFEALIVVVNADA